MQIQFEPHLLPINQESCLLTFGYWYICFFIFFPFPNGTRTTCSRIRLRSRSGTELLHQGFSTKRGKLLFF